jgi:hypothetical protein
MSAYLYDQPIEYYRHGCTDKNGKFDPKKAAALGYSPAQFAAIKAALGDEEKGQDTAPLEEPQSDE